MSKLTCLLVLIAFAAHAAKPELGQAQDQMAQGEFAAALKTLDRLSPQADNPLELSEIELLRGQLLLALQRKADARAAFAQALRLNPEATLDPSSTAPSTLEFFDAVKAVAKRPTTAVEPTPQPSPTTLPPSPPADVTGAQPSARRQWPWALVGVGAAAAIVGGVLLARSVSLYGQLTGSGPALAPGEGQRYAVDGPTFQTAGWACLGGGLAVALVGAGLLLFGGPSSDAPVRAAFVVTGQSLAFSLGGTW